MRGDDVALLQRELGLLGFTIPAVEIEQQLFDQGTQQAVLVFQRQHLQQGLEASGVVDERTAAAVNAEVDALPPRQFGVRGQVHQTDGTPAAGLVVRAFDEDPQHGEILLGEAASSAGGAYAIAYTSHDFDDRHGQRPGPDLLVRALDAQGAVLATSPVVAAAQPAETIDLVIEPAPERPLAVQGQVLAAQADGPPVAVAGGLVVRAFDRDLRAEELLGETTTDKGRYQIRYGPDQASGAEEGSADLVVKAFDANGSLLVASPVLFNAPPLAEVDLTIPLERSPSPALFDRLQTAVVPLLGELPVDQLEEGEEHQDLTFLAGETGYARALLGRFALAQRLARMGIQPEFWFALLGSAPLGYAEDQSLDENLSRTSNALASLDAAAAGRALERSFAQRELDPALHQNTQAWTEGFVRLMARRCLEQDGAPTFAKLALEHAGIHDPERQDQFAEIFSQYRTLTPELLATLSKNGAFKQAEIADLTTSYRLAELTQADFTVVRMLKDQFDIRRPEQVRSLAKLSQPEWTELIQTRAQDGSITLPPEFSDPSVPAQAPQPELYASVLERQFREAFPTAAFTGGLQRALGNGGATGMAHAEPLARFLDAHPEFELLATPIDPFLSNGVQPDFQPLAGDAGFRRELKAVQRVFKLAPTFAGTDALLGDGLHSAQRVYRTGESQFVRRYAEVPGLSADDARLVWNRAADTYAAVLTVVGELQALRAEQLPVVLQTGTGDAALESFPNWENLFQAGDLCACDDCRSVLGPAAYFADLLMFLNDRKLATAPPSTVKDVLFKRRADLGYLELTCENATTTTTLPYVDLVCEVLERAVAAGDSGVELKGLTAIADAEADKPKVAAALAAKDLDTGARFSLSQVDPADADRWVVHGEDLTLLLKQQATANFFAQVLPNTKASSEELRACPAYADPQAYEKLRQARFPLGLPFDLSAEEVRAAFRKRNLQRWDLMGTLHGPTAPNNATEGEVAAEYFGISTQAGAPVEEKRLILTTPPTPEDQQAVWGETGNPGWLGTIANVKTFLGKTALDYDELLALLDLPFINPAGDLSIQHLDGSCDTNKKLIQGLTADTLDALDRIHRFLRLWRKLDGWAMWELDRAIRSDGIGHRAPDGSFLLDEPFLINLYYLDRVWSRLGARTTVEQLCALVDDLNTETHFTEEHQRRADGLYQRLFLNKKLTQPLDPAFAVAAVDTPGPTAEKISAHRQVILAALGVRDAQLDLLAGLTGPTNTPYITDDLTLGNLSFLWRHAWLSKTLKVKVNDWTTILKLIGQDVGSFASPKAALDFIDTVDQLVATGFTSDELDWLLTANRTARAAVKKADATRFLAALRTDIQAVHAQYDPAQYDYLDPPSDVDRLQALLATLLPQLHRDEPAAQLVLATLRDEVQQQLVVAGLPAGFHFPDAIKNTIRISYDEPTTTLRLTGMLTDAQRATLLHDSSLAAVTGIKAYQDAVEAFFQGPRLALKFLDPVFTEALPSLPAAVDFAALSDRALAARVSWDAEVGALQVVGALSAAERDALAALSGDPADPAHSDYQKAVTSLFTQPTAGTLPPERIWLQDTDLQLPLRNLDDPASDKLADNLATAVNKALGYLAKAAAESLVIQRASGQLGLTDGLTRRLLTHYDLLPEPLLAYLTGPFAATGGAVDDANPALKPAFDGWYWAHRVAALWKKWKLTVAECKQLDELTTPPKPLDVPAKLLDFAALPLDDAAAMAPLDQVLRTSRLIRFKHSIPETATTLLDVLSKLSEGAYGDPATPAARAGFAADVERLNDAWRAADVAAFVGALDLAYPGDYLLAESWERLRRAFSFAASLNASAAGVLAFAAATMTPDHVTSLRKLLRSALGDEAWLALCTEIQDVLRERKRDALVAYLLTLPKPADAPTGKWENPNDLYAYYLLDVEMSACQLTSRLVGGSGSVQLFVQRCFMGLEPQVTVQADGPDGDSAWRWWAWMRKYRVWEANRKVFLWPENWIEPELKKDRSSFFKELEAELTQNELTQDSAETAFANYLEKLTGVAQLEPAGFYQQDDGANTIVHVFGRTRGTEPHTYYYRRFDYWQWTPWEKVDLDIKEDYLIPAVVGNRLFLFWPVFTEVPDDAGNSSVPTPDLDPSKKGELMEVQKASKKLRLQIAVSDYRNGKWTPKRVSKDYVPSATYKGELVRKQYSFFPIDRASVDGRFGIAYSGSSRGPDPSDETPYAALSGSFVISGCHGVPELGDLSGWFQHPLRPTQESVGQFTSFLKWEELDARDNNPQDDFTLQSTFTPARAPALTPLLERTPGIFDMSPPWQLSYLDQLWLGLSPQLRYQLTGERGFTPAGTWLPFFYNDQKRTFFVLPELPGRSHDLFTTVALPNGDEHRYYPEIKREFRALHAHYEAKVPAWVTTVDLATLSPTMRQLLEVPVGEEAPPFTDQQRREHLLRIVMQLVDYHLGTLSLQLFQTARFEFRNFYHPFVCEFAKLVENPLQGINGLMRREVQLQDSGFSFASSYGPTARVADWGTDRFYPQEVVDFTADGACSPYNWELFFHGPLLVANALSRNQRFEEAREWYHFIFNPIGVESAVPGGSITSKYWITKPFYQTSHDDYVQQRIENLLAMLAGDTSVPGYSQTRDDLERQVGDWRTHPFEPHRIANYRTVAYQKTVVMKYLDNLLAWGDYLFAQDSMESINEATQLYILAAELLGPPPRRVPAQEKPPLASFNELQPQLDAFANALVEVENLVPPQAGTGQSGTATAPLPTLFFCIPHNDKLLGYWDTVADRLYKIRHCMNIEGVVRQLALFEPPIDPGALVKAVAAGVDLSSALADLGAPLPLHRFTVLLQKANEVCSDVKALGSALLSALEKTDAEALSLLRQSQEISVLTAQADVRQKQIDEATDNLEGVKRSKELAEIKRQYYQSRPFMSLGEIAALGLTTSTIPIDASIPGAYSLSGVFKAIPQFNIGGAGFGGTPAFNAETGGQTLGAIAGDAAQTLSSISHIIEKGASIASTVASYQRRQDDWDHQRDLAVKEIQQLNQSIAAAELRVAIAEKELANHLAQIDNAKAIDDFMRTKYTNQELFQWQVGQISQVYFKSYKLAHDLAKRAERCYRFELGLQDSSIIRFGYWDSLKKGLLAGEQLQYDLRRLETSYLEQNRREFELTKHVSLALLDPHALVKLRETGRCFFRLPEVIYDHDYPGHYFRRIKSVSLTLPCVTGPYTTISCTLRLLKSTVRISTGGDYPRNTDDTGLPVDDPRFVETTIPVKAIAASSGQNDPGVFELSFHDERYLPFEGAGADSEWSLELFNDLPANNPDPTKPPDFGRPLRQFDYGSISDAVLHLKYTAREDAGPLKNHAITHLRAHFRAEDPQAAATPSLLLLNLRRDFPTQWSRFLNPATPADGNVFELPVSPDLFPYKDAGKTLKVNTIAFLARADADAYLVTLTPPLPLPTGSDPKANQLTLSRRADYGGLHFGEKPDRDAAVEIDVEIDPAMPPQTWQAKMTRPAGGNLTKDEVQDVMVILGYQWESP